VCVCVCVRACVRVCVGWWGAAHSPEVLEQSRAQVGPVPVQTSQGRAQSESG
jgi:hypothetical protein